MKAVKPPKKPNPSGPLKSSVASNVINMPVAEKPRFVAQEKRRVVGGSVLIGMPLVEHTVLDTTCPQPDGTTKEEEICLCPGPNAANLIAAALNLYVTAKKQADAAFRKMNRSKDPIEPKPA